MSYAVIKTGGKQYRVQQGDVLRVELLDAEEGAAVKFDQVLLVGEGESITVGAPHVAGARRASISWMRRRASPSLRLKKRIRNSSPPQRNT